MGQRKSFNADTLKVASETLNLPIKTSALFTRQGASNNKNLNAIIAKPKVISTAFSDDVLEEDNNSELIQLNEEAQVVLRVNKHIPATEKPFKQVQANIIKQLMVTALQKKAEDLGREILTALQKGEPAKSLAEQYKLTWQTEKAATRQTIKPSAQVIQAAFKLPNPNKQKQHPSTGVELKSGDYVIVQVTQSQQGKPFPKEQQQSFISNLARTRGMLDYALYSQGLQDNAKIKKK